VVATVRERGSLPVQRRVHVGYRPEDVVITLPGDASATSAINRFALTVHAMVPAESLVRVRLAGQPQLAALVTRRSAESLGLRTGTMVVAQIKATAMRAFPSP
jgi:molybdopterin-binding protein